MQQHDIKKTPETQQKEDCTPAKKRMTEHIKTNDKDIERIDTLMIMR